MKLHRPLIFPIIALPVFERICYRDFREIMENKDYPNLKKNNHALIYTLFVWMFVCLFVSNKRQNWYDTSQDPREGLLIIKITKISLQKNSTSTIFSKIAKFFINPWFLVCFCFTMNTNRKWVRIWKIGANRPEGQFDEKRMNKTIVWSPFKIIDSK